MQLACTYHCISCSSVSISFDQLCLSVCPSVGPYSIVFAGGVTVFLQLIRVWLIVYCLCTVCVLSVYYPCIVSKSLGRDNSEFRVSRICMVVHRSVTKTVGVFNNSALIHLDLGLVFITLTLFFPPFFCPVGPCDRLPSVYPLWSVL